MCWQKLAQCASRVPMAHQRTYQRYPKIGHALVSAMVVCQWHTSAIAHLGVRWFVRWCHQRNAHQRT